MNGFQYGALTVLTLLAILTVRNAISGRARKRVTLLWMTIWLTGAGATAWPNATRDVARKLGIGRGTDLVMYCSVLLLMSGLFYIYTRMRSMDRTMTLLVRELAIERAKRADVVYSSEQPKQD